MDGIALPFKIGEKVDGQWRAFRHADEFMRTIHDGEPALLAASSTPFETLLALIRELEAPHVTTLVLHTPRGEGQAGRYTSPPMETIELLEFLTKYRAAFERDARADVEIVSNSDWICYDKHDYLVCRGRLDVFESVVRNKGLRLGKPSIPLPHTHHFREEFDVDFAAMLEEVAWTKSPLLPSDGD